MWLIQWAPGASLAGWALAVVVLPRLGRDGTGLTFILLGMVAGAALWAAVAVCSLPLFFLIRPLVDPLARKATRLRAASLAAVGAAPFLAVAMLGWWLLPSLNTRGEHTARLDFFAVLALCVTFGVGAFAAVEMWTLAFPANHDRRSQFEEYRDITLAVRVKEDLEILRLLLANNALALLSMLTIFLPLAIVGFLILAYQGAGDFEGRRWVALVPLAALLLLAPILIVLTSYQARTVAPPVGPSLWRAALRGRGCHPAPVSIEPVHELYGGISVRIFAAGMDVYSPSMVTLSTLPCGHCERIGHVSTSRASQTSA